MSTIAIIVIAVICGGWVLWFLLADGGFFS